jgi:dynein heavy chain
LEVALNTCSEFKVAYHEYKQKCRGQWKITHNALFNRLDTFQERCHDVMHLTQTIIQFKKLENINIGNTKGKSLSQTIMQIYDDFNEAKDKFMLLEYDIMDI